MRKEYHESQKVEEIMKYGFWVNKTKESNGLAGNFMRAKFNNMYRKGLADLNLMIKYFDIQGLKPKAIRTEIERLWVNFNEYIDGPWLTKQIQKIRKKGNKQMIDVEPVFIGQDTLNWFKEMIHKTSDEWIAEGNETNSISERSEGEFGIERTKCLFQLYVWSLIQRQYSKYPNNIYLSGNRPRLKREAWLKGKTKLMPDCMYPMYDWGIWDSTFDEKDKWMLNFSMIPEDGEKTIEVPLEFSGKWFEEICGEKNSRPPKQVLPSKCPCCHKKFDRKSHNPKELCPDCAKKKRAEAARERRKREKTQKQ